MNYEESIAYIHSVMWQGSRPGLERITKLLSKMKNPQKDLKVIHVTGTNGKGSFCAMLDSILRQSGYRTGLFTSPYIEHFEERMMVNGRMISREMLAEITSEIKPLADSMEDLPTEFELITAIGFAFFKKMNCDVCVIEAGMGGRLDSTNVFEKPILSVITGVALDHTAFLGDSTEKIAYEKAGIIKKGCPVLLGNADEKALSVIEEKAVSLASPVTKVDYDKIRNLKASLAGSTFDFDKWNQISIPLIGLYQPRNAANVLSAVEILQNYGFHITDDSLRQGLMATVWKARFEKLSENPTVLYDGSHNPEGIAFAVRTIKELFGETKVKLVTGVMEDKDHSGMAKSLSEVAAQVYTVTPNNPRSYNCHRFAAEFSEIGIKAKGFDSIDEAVQTAITEDPQLPLIGLGSLYLYSDFKKALFTALSE